MWQAADAFARVRLVTEPAGAVGGGEDQRHAIADFRNEFVGVGGDDRKGSYPFTRSRGPWSPSTRKSRQPVTGPEGLPY
jgi:hypothetical protein